MANICYSDLYIIGKLDEVQELSNKIIESNFDMQKLLPYEEFPADFIKKYEDEKVKDDNEKFYYFYTSPTWIGDAGKEPELIQGTPGSDEAVYSRHIFLNSKWSPPSNSLRFLSKKYPDLILKCWYADMLADFAGTLIYSDGVLVMRDHEESYFSRLEEERLEKESNWKPYWNVKF